jgi:hypothetical protein
MDGWVDSKTLFKEKTHYFCSLFHMAALHIVEVIITCFITTVGLFTKLMLGKQNQEKQMFQSEGVLYTNTLLRKGTCSSATQFH